MATIPDSTKQEPTTKQEPSGQQVPPEQPESPGKQRPPWPTAAHFAKRPHDFSLVLGGPLFQLFRRLHLSGKGLELLNRRAVAIPLFAWLPLLLLAIFGGPESRFSFLHDVEVHVRFIVALPILIASELIVHFRLRPVVPRFVKRRIVKPHNMPRFDKAIESGLRLRSSVAAEVTLLILVYAVGPWLWHGRVPILSPTWYAMPGGRWHLTPAGFWYVFVSIPILQFILLRWYFRFFIWYRFLWHVSRINLHLISTHPDHAAGLAFLGKTAWAFAPILFAQGAMVAGIIANRVLYRGETLVSFKLWIIGFVAFFVFAIFGPLMMFTPLMSRAKRKGLTYYGQLAQDYVEGFERKWVLRKPGPVDDLLGSGDIQSLADLNNSYEIVSSMRLVPFGLKDMSRLAAATAAPFVPLLLTVFSPEELFEHIVKFLL